MANTLEHKSIGVIKPIRTPKDRLPIYQEMLRRVNNENYGGLCIGLLEFSGRSFMDSDDDTGELFPEFGKHIQRYKPTSFLDLMDDKNDITQAWRIKVLKDCIKQCNNAILK